MSCSIIQVAVLIALGVSPSAVAGADKAASDAARPTGVSETLNSQAWNSRLRPVPADATRTRHYYRMATGEQFTGDAGLEALSSGRMAGSGAASGGEDDPVYSCTPPLTNNLLFVPGANRLIADDITTVAVGGCDLEAFEFILGGGGDGTGPGFGIEFALYDACPGDGGQPGCPRCGSLDLSRLT